VTPTGLVRTPIGKRNGSHTHNNCKFLGASQRVSERCSSCISYPELIYILQYCQVIL